MISSIIPLPEFALPDTIIDGRRNGGIFTGVEEMYWAHGGVNNPYDNGRCIRIIPNAINKYKIQFDDLTVMRRYVVVFITLNVKLDVHHLSRHLYDRVEIYPIYIREYPLDGTVMRLPSNLILNLYGINRLFEAMQVPPVVSPTEAMYHAMDVASIEDLSTISKYLADRLVDPNLATVAPAEMNLVEQLYEGSGPEMNTFIENFTILKGYLPRKADYILHITELSQLLPMIDPHYMDNLASHMVFKAMQSWGEYFNIIHNNVGGAGASKYVARCSDTAVDYLLWRTSSIATSDFQFTCPRSQLDTHNAGITFDDRSLTHGVDPITDYHKLSTISSAVQCFNYHYEDRRAGDDYSLKLVGSYLEDLMIYDSTDLLLAYIDMVWWILAQGSGLLNRYDTII